MLLKLIHTTDLTYNEPIAESVVELRMFPREEASQHRLSFELKLQPYSTVNSYFDWLGNTVHTFTINGVHQAIHIVATSIVETEKFTTMPETLPDTWPMRPTQDYQLWDYLQFGGPVVQSPELAELAKELYARPGIRIGELGQRMIRLINTRFEYEKGITTSASPVTDMLKARKGVCQDYTHLMIALAPKHEDPGPVRQRLPAPGRHRHRTVPWLHAKPRLVRAALPQPRLDRLRPDQQLRGRRKLREGRRRPRLPRRAAEQGPVPRTGKESIDVSVKTEVLPSIPRDLFPEKIMPMGVASSNGVSLPSQQFQRMGTMEQSQQQAAAGYHSQQQQQQQSPDRAGWRRVPFGPRPR